MLLRYEQWHTAGDMAVCPTCQALDKRIFLVGTGPAAGSIHPHCRCRRSFHHEVLIEGPYYPGDDVDVPESELTPYLPIPFLPGGSDADAEREEPGRPAQVRPLHPGAVYPGDDAYVPEPFRPGDFVFEPEVSVEAKRSRR